GPFNAKTDVEIGIQLEAVVGTSPGALVGGDFARFRHGYPFKLDPDRLDRDEDADNTASVTVPQKGRERTQWELMGGYIPSANGTTPTVIDCDQLYEGHFGSQNVCTAHTTTAAGSVGTSIVLTPGGGAASGIPTTGGALLR